MAVIDPTLVNIPEDDPDDFPPPHLILPRVARSVTKTAGSRRPDIKGKGKVKAGGDFPGARGTKHKAALPSEEPEPKKKRGRMMGISNYSSEDIDSLLDIVEEILPIGGKA